MPKRTPPHLLTKNPIWNIATMSNSKFAIKHIKEHENNPQVWDAAYELATEWSFDVAK